MTPHTWGRDQTFNMSPTFSTKKFNKSLTRTGVISVIPARKGTETHFAIDFLPVRHHCQSESTARCEPKEEG